MQRVTLIVVVEGHSENGFFKPFLTEHLASRGIDLSLPIVGKGSSKGGMLRGFEKFCREIGHYLLTDGRKPVVSTFVDYYGLPSDQRRGWGFVAEARSGRRVEDIEARIREGVESVAGPAVDRFIPYVQLHELEALYFAEPAVLAEVLGASSLVSTRLQKIVEVSGSCESINNSPTTAPSKRLEKLCPKYQKGRSSMAHAPRLATRLNLATVRTACPRFDAWLTRVEALAPAV